MTKNNKDKMSPIKLRLLLLVSIVALIGVAAAGFWFFNERLSAYAHEVQAANAAASASSSDVTRLKQLGVQLEEDKVAVERAKNIVADSKYYQYQDQIIADLTAYAKAAKVQITSIDFNTATTGGVGAAPATTPAQPAPAGLKSTSASVTLNNPVDYHALIRFIHFIELNLTKMQLTGVTLQRDEVSGGTIVNPLTIEVYTR